MSRIEVSKDNISLAEKAAEYFISIVRESVQKRGQFSVALAGGSTPRGLYSLLASGIYQQRVDWGKVHVFWGDERAVPPDHPDSNYLMARQTLLDPIRFPEGNIHRIQGELEPKESADLYEKELKATWGSDEIRIPRFDLILLGMGDDGHIASLFPETDALHEHLRWVAENHIPKLDEWRITFTAPLINSAAHILFLVSGKRKAEVLASVLEGKYQPEKLPAQLIRPTGGELIWLVDQAAGEKLKDPQ